MSLIPTHYSHKQRCRKREKKKNTGIVKLYTTITNIIKIYYACNDKTSGDSRDPGESKESQKVKFVFDATHMRTKLLSPVAS